MMTWRHEKAPLSHVPQHLPSYSMAQQSVITQVGRSGGDDLRPYAAVSTNACVDGKAPESRSLFSQDANKSRLSPAPFLSAAAATSSSNHSPRTKSNSLVKTLLCCMGVRTQRHYGRRRRSSSFISTSKFSADGKKFLLPPARKSDANKKCLIIDLDETLVHSSFQPIPNADYVVPVEIDGITHQVYVLKRPHVDAFLQNIGELFECILFTASLGKYAVPVADLLDRRGIFRARLLREACVLHDGNYVKDLRKLGRDLHKVIILDNSPASYAFHPENALPVQSWYDDANDTELLDILPVLEKLALSDDIYPLLKLANSSRTFRSITMLCANPVVNESAVIGPNTDAAVTTDKPQPPACNGAAVMGGGDGRPIADVDTLNLDRLLV